MIKPTENQVIAGWGILIAAAVLAVFGRSLWFPAEIMDDVLYLGQMNRLEFSWENLVYWWHTPILELRSPLQMWSYMLDYLVWRGDWFIFGVHLNNQLLHILAAFLVFLLGRECGLRNGFAGCTALIFALHPQRIESVVWLAERKDVLVVPLALLALYWFLRDMRGNRQWWMQFFPALLYAMSLLVKPMAILLPFILLAFLWWERRAFDWRIWLRSTWVFFVVMFVFMAWRFQMVHGFVSGTTAVTDGWNMRIGIIADNFANYFLKTFYPYSLCPVYPFYHPEFNSLLPPAVCLLLVAAILLICRKAGKLEIVIYELLPLAVCFFAALAPVVGFVRVGNTDFADRYSYLAAVFLWLAAGILAQRLYLRYGRGRWFFAGWAGYLAFLVIYSLNYLSCWSNSSVHLAACLDVPNPNYRQVFLAGVQAYYIGDWDMVQRNMEKLRYPESRQRQFDIYRRTMQGMMLLSQGKEAEALEVLNRVVLTRDAVSLRDFSFSFPGEVMRSTALLNLKYGNREYAALVFQNLGANYEGRSWFDSCFYFGMAALIREQWTEAERFFIKALAENPGDENTIANLKMIRAKLAEAK
jgi:hypothetical protein